MTGSRRVATTALALGFAAVLASPAIGQETSVRAYLTPGATVGAGSAFVLNVEVTGAQSVDREPGLPDLSPWARFLGSSTQSSMQMVNGRTTVSLTIQYRFQALSEGTHVIPSFAVAAGGRTHTTAPIEVTVSADAPPASEGGGPVVGADDLFITAEASATRVLEGEPLVVEYRIWTRVDVTNFGVTSVPEPEGFWVEDLTPGGQPRVEQRVRDGVQYATALIRRVALVPSGPGRKRVEPIGVDAQVRVRSGRDPFESFFGRSSLFGTTVPAAARSNALTIEVAPLPDGRPQPFSGVVGRLELSASLDRDSVETNGAVTLTVEVRGDGNLRAVQPPSLGLPSDFELFAPEVSESVRGTPTGLTGTKSFEYVMIPRAPGRREIPTIRLGYYDTDTRGYRTLETDPIPLTVTGGVVDGPVGLARGGVDQLRRDIRFIRLGPLELRRSSGSPIQAPGFWLFALLPLVGVAGAVGLRRHRDLVEGDVAYARGRRASRVARKRLSEARRLARADDPRPFYAEVARALRGLVADRLNLAEAGLQTVQLDDLLAGRGVEAGVRDGLRACLEHCDRQRFAPPGGDGDERTRMLETAADLMTGLDRALR